jgi:hypothetical protein
MSGGWPFFISTIDIALVIPLKVKSCHLGIQSSLSKIELDGFASVDLVSDDKAFAVSIVCCV